LKPTAATALAPTAADGLSLAPTAADGVSVDYNVSVSSISDAEAVEAVVETTTPADVDLAVEAAATEVEAETGTTITLVDSIATTDVSAVEIAADPPGTPGDDGDDAPTLGLSEVDDGASDGGGGGGSGGGGGGGADAAAAGGAVAAGVILLLALGTGLYVYRRRGSKAPAAAEDDVERAISKQLAVPDLLPLHALAPEDVAAWLRRQDLPGDVDGLCTAVIKRKINGATLRDADDASLKELGATLGLRKAVLKLLRAEPPAPRRADDPPPPPPPPPPLPPPPAARPGHL